MARIRRPSPLVIAALTAVMTAGCTPLLDGFVYDGLPSGAGTSAQGYLYGQCTDYAAQAEEALGTSPSLLQNLGDAGQWPVAAAREGVAVDNVPVVGAVAVIPGNPGHVAVVVSEDTDGDTPAYELKGMNYTGHGEEDDQVSALPGRYTTFIHFERTHP